MKLYASILSNGEEATHTLADGRHAWVQLISGSLTLNSEQLNPGDGAAISSEAEIKQFADALATSLMSRYGASLISFDEGLKVKVVDETSMRGGAIVKVSSEFERSNGDTVPVDYLMHKVGGKWKVFDVMVEGVSFVQTFRRQFDNELTHKSIRQVASELASGKVSADAGR